MSVSFGEDCFGVGIMSESMLTYDWTQVAKFLTTRQKTTKLCLKRVYFDCSGFSENIFVNRGVGYNV